MYITLMAASERRGRRKAIVFPVPVGEQPIISLPCINKGIPCI